MLFWTVVAKWPDPIYDPIYDAANEQAAALTPSRIAAEHRNASQQLA